MLCTQSATGVVLLTVEDVLAGSPRETTNTVPSEEPTGTGASTPLAKPNPSTRPKGTVVPTPLFNLNTSPGPPATGAPTPVSTESIGTDASTPLSSLNTSSGPPATGAPTPVPTESIGTDASTPLSSLNTSSGPPATDPPTPVSTESIGTDAPTPLSSLNTSSGPPTTGAPTPVSTESIGTVAPTPLSSLNTSSGPPATGASTPAPTVPIVIHGSTVTSILNPSPGYIGTGATSLMTSINPSAASMPTNAPTPKFSLKPSVGPSADTPSRVPDVTPSSGHTGTGTTTSVSKQSVRPTSKPSSTPNVKTSTESFTSPSHISSTRSNSQSTEYSLVTSVRPSIAVQSPTGESPTVSITKVTVETSPARKLPTTSEDVKVSTAVPTSATSPTTEKTQATKSQTTTKPQSSSRENKTECFEHLGCFDNFPPFDNAGLDLPYSPDIMKTKFWLFTRKNLKMKHVLDYRNISTFTSFDFDATKPTKFITHGFSQDALATWVVEMKDEFLRLGDFNVITVDWKKGAEFPNYDKAVANTRLVATQIKVVVDILVQRGLKLQDLHLAGHSLGAHTSGYAGFLMNGKVGRISGMDPAEPDFENLPDIVRLDKADALFVDVIHTNGESVLLGGFGLMESSGHVDFFVNGGESQPGCKGAISGALSSIFGKGGSIGKEVACSHGRSHQLYIESMSSPCPFTSYPCPSYDDFKKGKCLTCGSTGCSQLGYYADQYYARGKMYLNTGSKTPFCGYHYGVEIKTSSTKDTKGRLYVKMEGTWGTSDFIPVTGDDAVKAGSEVQDVILSPMEVGDLKSLVFKYVKHSGFWLGGGEDTLGVERVKVTSGENGDSYLFCYGGKEVQHNTEARTTIKARTAC